VTQAVVAVVDVLVIRRVPALEILLLRRARGGRHPGSWESVSGSIEPGESPVDAARREVREETGLVRGSLWNLSHVESFYWHERGQVALAPAFVWLVDDDEPIRLSDEHDDHEWLPLDQVASRAQWPRLVREVGVLRMMTGSDGAGWLDDSLRILGEGLERG
jgi:dATP pyrophosphohydrolase